MTSTRTTRPSAPRLHLGGEPGQPVDPSGAQDHHGAPRRQLAHGRLADAAAHAGDGDDLALCAHDRSPLERDVEDLVACVPQLLATHAPVQAMSRWLHQVADYARLKRDVFAAVEAATSRRLAAHSLGPIGDAVEQLLAAGRDDGSLRADVRARDVIILISWLSRLDDDELDERGLRLLSVLVEGLRPPRPS